MSSNKNNFNKQLFTRYIESECERQLLLELARIKPKMWYTDSRNIEKPKRIRSNVDLITELGKKYEQKVYKRLNRLKETRGNIGKSGKITGTYLNPKLFKILYNELKSSPLNDLVLLEYQYDIPESYFRDIFPSKDKQIEIPVDYGDQRPDIMVIGNTLNNKLKKVRELLPSGSIREVPDNELKTRLGISIIDIKNIREDHIGKKQFMEIFYYLYTLAWYIKENGLCNHFYVRLDFNGILPQWNEEKLDDIKDFNDLNSDKFTIFINWIESYKIYTDTIKKIKQLWKKCPCPIESIELNIQPSCGYCFFIEDCKKTLGIEMVDPKDWSLKLIPYTSISIAQQLIDKGFKTIEDVANNLSKIVFKDMPEPLYSELPLLELKARALLNSNVLYPPTGKIHAYSIPKYSSIVVDFAVETDPANNRVYAAGFYLFISASTKTPFGGVFDNWWRIWRDALRNNKIPKQIQTELNEVLVRPINLVEVEEFFSILNKLNFSEKQIALKGDNTKNGKIRKNTIVFYQYATINKDHDNDSEAEFTRKVINKLYYIFEFCSIIENFVVTDGFEAGTYFGPTTSVFYWSKRQLTNFQNMLERNLAFLVDDVKIWRKFLSIISLFTPSDSEVAHPYQHKKLFNLQDFVETVIGFPSIISYTWHEIAKGMMGTKVNNDFWIPHFNYMDFNRWYEMLQAEEIKERKAIREEIRRQLMHKIRTINSLRLKFQIESKFFISKYARTIGKEEIKKAILPSSYHPIAQVWFLFSKLTGSIQEMDAEYFRTIYPEFSIGKLAAANVKDLKVHEQGKKCYYTFKIDKLSSNAKIDEGDRVLLIPDEKRDIRSNRRMESWKIELKKMDWDSSIQGYKIKTELTYSNLFEKINNDKEIIEEPDKLDWFLFPFSFDAWSKKLYERNGLLQRCNFGLSWLGGYLSYKWNIRAKQELNWPFKWQFSAPSLYLFAPQLLIQLTDGRTANATKNLLTNIHPPPDISQEKAIQSSLENIISGIQGPPGTGKSMTVAALVDEYYKRQLKRGKKSVRILITSFSYAAIRVNIDKIREAKDAIGNPVESSKLQMIFLRSEYQESILPKAGYRNVDDLVRKSGGAWRWNDTPRIVTETHSLEEQLEDSFILFANAHQLYHLTDRVDEDFSFDLICVDEASQLPVDYFMSSLQFIHNQKFNLKPIGTIGKPGSRIRDRKEIEDLDFKLGNEINIDDLTKVVIVGDYNQLPPVQPVPPPKNLERILESLFGYYVKSHQIPNEQLQINYRSNKDIVEYTSKLGIYKNLRADKKNANQILQGNFKLIKEKSLATILDPKKVVSTIIHERKYEIGVSILESELVSRIIIGYFGVKKPKNPDEEIKFWREEVGIVSPHNAQGRIIIRKIYDEMTNSKQLRTTLKPEKLMNLLKNTIYSVEKFQGSDRELIISSIGISDKDQLNTESEFIYNLNRFNVLTSRAKCKIILIASRKFLNFIPSDKNIMEEAAHIRMYAKDFCNKKVKLEIKNEDNIDEIITFRYKG